MVHFSVMIYTIQQLLNLLFGH